MNSRKTRLRKLGLIWSMVLLSLFTGCKNNSRDKIEAEGEQVESAAGRVVSGVQGVLSEVSGSAANKKLTYRRQGIDFMSKGDYASARNAFELALSFSNGLVKKVDVDISYYLGVCEVKLGDYDAAVKTFSAIIGLNEKADEAYYMRGKVELMKGDKAAALADYDRAVGLKPSKYELYQKIFVDLYEAGYEEEAGAYIGRAVSENEKMGDYQRGVFSYYIGDYDEARNYLEKARNNKSDDVKLIIYQGRTYEALGDSAYAASLYQTWLQSNEPDGTIYNELGLIKLDLSDVSGALSAFQAGIELNDPNFLQSHRFNEIVAYERLGDFSQAKSKMSAYLADYPTDQTAAREYEFLGSR